MVDFPLLEQFPYSSACLFLYLSAFLDTLHGFFNPIWEEQADISRVFFPDCLSVHNLQTFFTWSLEQSFPFASANVHEKCP